MSHISANNIDRKLIIVSISMFSGSRNPNVTLILVCGSCGSHFQNGRHEFSMSHISANNKAAWEVAVFFCTLVFIKVHYISLDFLSVLSVFILSHVQ